MKQSTLPVGQEYELYTEIKELFHAGAKRLHKNKYGPKIYTDLQRVALLILYVRSGCSLRRFCEVYLIESRWPKWLGLRELPGKSTLHDWMNQFDMSLLRKLNKQLLADEQPRVMAIDGTGLNADSKSAHYAHRIRAPMKKGPKLDIIVDTDSLLVHDWSLLLKPRHDAYVAKNLLKRTPRRGVLILGDKGYDSEELYKICEQNNNHFWAPIKNAPYSDQPPKKLGRAKKRSHKQLCNKQTRRSLVESTFYSLKNRFQTLRARLPYMKKRELAWHILARNIETKISLLLRYIFARFEVLVRYAHHT